MNEILLSIVYTVAFLIQIIPAIYALIADRRAAANVAVALLFTVFAINSLANSALVGIFSLDKAMPWIVVLVSTTFMIGPAVYLAAVATLRPAWLRHRWLYYPVYLLLLFPALLVLADVIGISGMIGRGPFVFIPPSPETYIGGAPALGQVTAGRLGEILRTVQTVFPALALICPMIVVGIVDRRADPETSRLAWVLGAATLVAGASQVFLSASLPLSLTTIIANSAYILAFTYGAFSQPARSWSLDAVRRSLGNWPVFAKLILVLITVFIPSILVITSVSGSIVRRSMTAQIGTSFNALARLEARGIADALRTQVEELTALSRSPVLLSTLNQRNQQTSDLDEAALRAWLDGEELEWVLSDLTMAEQIPADFTSSLSILTDFQRRSRGYTFLQLTDRNGGLISATATPAHFDFSNAGWWRSAHAGGTGAVHVSVPLRDPATASRYVQIAMPIFANDGTTVVGVLMGHFSLDDLIASLAAAQVGIAGRTHLFSPNGVLITISPQPAPAPGLDAADQQIALDWGDLLASPTPWRILAYDRVSSIVSWTTVGDALPDSPVETIQWRITIYQPISEALAGITAAQEASFVTALLTAVVAMAFSWLFAGFITQPISSLTAVAERVLDGDLDVRAEVTGSDEVGVLASTFNTMTGRLRDLVANLESQVRARTADLESQTRKLQAASQVGQGVISILDPDELMRTSVDVIRERFGLYYVGMFLNDEEGEWAVLQAGTGQAGRQLLSRGHRIRVGEGMVGWSIRNGRARAASETAADIVRLTNPELPDTRSEAAIPLRARGQTIGALTIQSTRTDEFDPTTVGILQSLADQLGIAIDNANLLKQNQAALQESRQALETVRRTYQQVTREAWNETILQQRWDLVATPEGVSAMNGPAEAPSSADGTIPLDVPIKVRDITVGTIRLRKPAESGEWTAAEKGYLAAYVNQLGSALDSARLFREIQERSVQLQTSSEVGQAANAVLQLDVLLPMAVDLIGERFHLYYTGIFLVEKDEAGDEWAVLRAGSGEAGRVQIEAGHRLQVGGQSMIGQAVAAREPRIAMDVGREAVRFENPLLPDTRTEMALPLIAGGEAIGAITIQSDRQAAFSADEITVFQTMANQLGTAIQNARLFEQSRIATETAQEQRRIADSLLKAAGRFTRTPEREDILRIIVEEIDEQIRPDQINVFEWLPDRSVFGLFHRHTPGDPEDDYAVGDLVTPEERPDLWQVFSEIRSDYNPERREDGFVHERYAAPLLQANESIGVVETFHTARDAHIRPEDQAVINGVLQQAAVAFRSAAAFRDTQEALARTEALYRVGQASIGMGSLPELLESVVETIAETLPAERVSITAMHHETETVTHFVQSGRSAAGSPPSYRRLMRGLTGWVIREQKPALSPKGARDPRDSAVMESDELNDGPHSRLVVPLVVRGVVLGTITAVNGPAMPDFNDEDAELLQAMATQTAVAIQNSELLAETRKTADNERLLNEIGSQLIQSLDFETILKTAVEEIGQLPNISGVTLTVGESEFANGDETG
ncbi:MAG TPA: GAF domain-containing protein [Anaerolineales bacterium]|nr:GAF domain-containing protein [Anaerolineales bacterium]